MRLDPAHPAHLLITGGGGFVGGNFIRLALHLRPSWRFTVLDPLAAGTGVPVLMGLEEAYPGRLARVGSGIEDGEVLHRLLHGDRAEAVVHFAAKNPSGRQEASPLEFTRVNVLGTASVLDAVRRVSSQARVLHLSSYEVYGSHPEGYFTESTPIAPSTPYAASKASADALTLSYQRTFGLDALVTRTTNIYGPFQSPDKFIPAMVGRALRDEALQVYGAGDQRRDWIHVDDHNRGVLSVLERGRSGEVYHIGARCERTNLQMAESVADAVASIRGLPQGGLRHLLTRVEDRAAHDPRRALDTRKTSSELGFRPEIDLGEGILQTIGHFTGVVPESGREG